MSISTVIIESHGPVAVITLNRPDNANTLNLQMGMDLLAAALACERNHEVRAVVLTGAGKNFCFGGDLRGMMSEGADVEPYLRELTSYLNTAISHFTRMDAPVIAAINGTVAGGGVGLAAMADLAVCAQSAKFSMAYTGVALTPDCSVSFLLPRLVGARRAMEMLLLNRAVTADEALAWGLVNQVVPDADVLPTAMKIAEKLAAGPKRAFGLTKRLMSLSNGAFEAQLVMESETIAAQAASAEGREGITAFLEKRKAQYPR